MKFFDAMAMVCCAVSSPLLLFGGDDPCSATGLPANMLEPTEVTIGASPSGVPDPGCGEFFDADEWFSFEAPGGGDVAIQLVAGTVTDAAFAVYQGSCNDLEEIICSEDYLCGQEPMPAYFLEDLTVGATYWIRVWNEDGPIAGDLEIQVSNPSGNPYLTTGDATNTSFEGYSNCIQLTAEANTQAGCAWYPSEVDFTESFTHNFNVYLGDIQGQAGADGLCIIYQTESIPVCGQTGGELGFGGLPNSLGIEFDTFINPPPYDDPNEDHTAISINGDVTNHISGPIGLGSIADGEFHDVTVDWDAPNRRLRVWFDGMLVHDLFYDIVNDVFGGNSNAYWGVSASTGGSINEHVLCFDNFEIENITDVYVFEEVTLCEGESIFLEGEWQTEPGTYVDVFPAANGCDSIYTTELDFYQISDTTFVGDTLCPGEVFFHDGLPYDQTGTYEVQYLDQNGCDSLVVVEILVDELDVVLESTGPITCGQDSAILSADIQEVRPVNYYWTTGSTFDTTIVFEAGMQWLDIYYGDDCVWSGSIEVEEVVGQIEVIETLQICPNSSINFHGEVITSPGIYEVLESNGGYCDTLWVADVEGVDYHQLDRTQELCQGGELMWEGMTIDTAGIYETILPSSSGGCDTLATLEVVETDPILKEDSSFLCPGDTIFWQGMEIDSAGIYETMQSSPGMACDTLLVLEVIRDQLILKEDSSFLCFGETILWEGLNIDSAGTYETILTAQSGGCDTLAMLEVIPKPQNLKIDSTLLCPGDTIHWEEISIDTAGTYERTLSGGANCDTLSRLFVEEGVNRLVFDTLTLCPGDTIHYGSLVIDSAGDYRDVRPTLDQCDSIFHLSVFQAGYEEKHLFMERCHGDTLELEGREFDTAGIYEWVEPATQGCDTLVQLEIVDIPPTETADSLTLCPGDTLQWQGLAITEAGNYQLRLPGEDECDTLASLVVEMDDYVRRYDSLERCVGEVLSWRGETIDTAGVYEFLFPATTGCDTLWEISVFDQPLAESLDTMRRCPGEELQWQGISIDTAGLYRARVTGQGGDCDTLAELRVIDDDYVHRSRFYQKCEEDTLKVGDLAIVQPGEYETLLDAEIGCDTLLEVIVEVRDDILLEDTATVCRGEVYTVRNTEYSVGHHEILFPGAGGCDTILQLEVREDPPLDLQLEKEGDLCSGEVQLTVLGIEALPTENYQWNSGETAASRTVRAGGRYELSAETAAGCVWKVSTEVEACIPCEYTVPNVFSPNGDGINDVLEMSASCGIENFRARIYDRWGERVNESRDPLKIWDGRNQSQGVYVYQINCTLVNRGEREDVTLHGTITLIR